MEALAARGFQGLRSVRCKGHSEVYHGSHPGCPKCTRQVAIKLQTFSSMHFFQKAYLEVQLMSGLSHPNIVRFCESFDYRETESTWVLGIVTEWVNKDLMQDLEDRRTHEYPWPEADFVQIAHSLISALAYLERMGIAHRDIKPGNIFYNPITKVAKIGDFGSAKSVFGPQDEHSVVGTPAYASEELSQAMKQQRTHVRHDMVKSDVHSLGQTLLVLATLEAPVLQRESEIVDKTATRLRSLQYTERVKELIGDMLETDPGRRPTFLQLEEKYASRC